MATTTQIERVSDGALQVKVTFTAQNDAVVFEARRASAMSIQALGAFTAATIDIQASNDGVTYAALPTAVSLNALGHKSVALADLGFRYYRVIQLVAGESHTAYIFISEQR